jgi:hypothetical protein
MNRKIIACFLLFACFGFSKQAAQDIAIVYIGDSITYGAGLAQKEEQAPPVLASRLLKEKTGTEVLFSNQGRSGFTTVDFLPASNKSWKQVVTAAKALQKENRLLIFSIMLGTNDSAEDGPNGAPVSPETYHKNLQTITDSLLAIFPESKIIIHQPVWYSTNTYNRSRYLAGGLARLQTYFPRISMLVRQNQKLHPGKVFSGDRRGFKTFKNKGAAFMQAEKGQQGIFYLHPNQQGAAVLAACWAKAIEKVLH